MRLVRTHYRPGADAAGRTPRRPRGLWAKLAGPAAVAAALAASLLVAAPAGALTHGAKAAQSPATSSVGTWGPISEFPGWSGGQASSVSCTSASDCTAVGTDGNDGSAIATKTDGIWAPAVDNDSFQPGFELYGVSCTDAADCTAVGGDYEGCDLCNAAVYQTETAGTWGEPTESKAGQPAYFSGVSCTSTTDCTAVGEDFVSDYGPFYQTETAGTWGTPTQLSGTGEFSGVSCTSATDCTAVGQAGFVFTETDGTWSSASGPSSTTSFALSGVSCTDATDCTVVGQDANNQPIYATETAGTWGPVTEITLPSSLGTSAEFSGVSCIDATDCTAVGEDGNNQPFYTTETDGTWGTPAEITVPGAVGSRGTFTSVSCTSITDCTAVGQVPDGAEIYATESAGQPSQTTITSTTASPVTGQPVSIAVQVAGASPGAGVPAPSGDVVVTDGTQSCQAALSGSNGVSTGSCSLTEDSAGSYSINAGYPGDANFASSQTSPGTGVTVGKATSTTGLTVSPATVTYGHEKVFKLTATVTPEYAGTPTGTVTMTAGTTTLCVATLSAGTGSCNPSSGTSLGVGSHTVTATYSGDSNFNSSTAAETVKITKAASTTSLTLSTATVTYGSEKSLVMTVKVTPQFAGIPGGKVIITAGSTTLCTVTLSGGTGKCSPASQTALSTGKHTVTATYQGSTNFVTSSASKTLTVNAA
jgi:hypothetical protein